MRRKPYSVVLLDEIEKAHPDVFNILLQILEDGKLTDAQGRKVDFRNTIVIMTSNIGAATISKNQSLGFSVGDDTGLSYDEMKDRIMGELKKVFRPELLNRIDEVIVFHKLTKDEIKIIVDLMMKRLREQMAEHEAAIELTEEAKELLVEKGYDPAMGARPLRRAIQRFIEDPLADFVLGRSIKPGSTIVVDRKDDEDEVDISIVEGQAPEEPEKVTVPAEPPTDEADADDDAPRRRRLAARDRRGRRRRCRWPGVRVVARPPGRACRRLRARLVGSGCSRGNTGWICPALAAPLPAPGVMGGALRGMVRRDSPIRIRPLVGPSFLRWSWEFWRACTPERYRAGLEATVALSARTLELFDALRDAGVDFETHESGHGGRRSDRAGPGGVRGHAARGPGGRLRRGRAHAGRR